MLLNNIIEKLYFIIIKYKNIYQKKNNISRAKLIIS